VLYSTGATVVVFKVSRGAW